MTNYLLTKELDNGVGWQPFQQTVSGEADNPKSKLDPCLTPYTKVNSKWIKHLEITLESIKYIKENIDQMLQDLDLKRGFNHTMPWTEPTESTLNNWDYITLKRF